MSGWIDMNHCCMDGLMIISSKIAAFQRDHRRYMEAAREEREHLKKCSECNPDLLIEQLFGSEARVSEEE